MTNWVRDADTWKQVIFDGFQVRDADTWKLKDRGDERDADTWKLSYSPEELVPVSDVTTESWEDTTGGDGDGDLFDEIDEKGDSDTSTTYIHNGPVTSQQTYRCTLANAAKDHHNRQNHQIGAVYRPHIDSDDDDLDITMELYSGITLVASTSTTATSADSGGWNTLNLTLTDAEANDIGDYTDLEMVFEVVNAQGTISDPSIDLTQMTLKIN